MGLIAGLARLAPGFTRTAEVFVENRTKRAAQDHAQHMASLGQLSAEFAHPPTGWFDCLVDGLNRLPRPAMALGTLGLFVFAMVDPIAFGVRMQGLALVPDALWWLLGAIVSFYFGARELHHRRAGGSVPPEAVAGVVHNISALRDLEPPGPVSDPGGGPVGGPVGGSGGTRDDIPGGARAGASATTGSAAAVPLRPGADPATDIDPDPFSGADPGPEVGGEPARGARDAGTVDNPALSDWRRSVDR